MRTSASTANLLMGPRVFNDFDESDTGVGNDGGCSLAMSDTPTQSPRILITRACSDESQDCESLLLKQTFSTATSAPVSEYCESKPLIKKYIKLNVLFSISYFITTVNFFPHSGHV